MVQASRVRKNPGGPLRPDELEGERLEEHTERVDPADVRDRERPDDGAAVRDLDQQTFLDELSDRFAERPPADAQQLRRDLPEYRGPSFGTIVALGRATEAEVLAYTTVLKSLVALSRTAFPKGTTGQRLDAVARSHLWTQGWEYRHGIGHGVGSYLHVHEGPQRFSKTNDVPLIPGMVNSCEPGVYIEGAFGVRLENALAIVPSTTTAFGTFYAFETLTLCPFDRSLIAPETLTVAER